MNSKTYQSLATRTDRDYTEVGNRLLQDENKIRMINAALGLSGEAGEVVDIIKKHITYNKPLDLVALKSELGDVLWYVSLMLTSIDSSFEEVMQMNIDKLKTRYPGGFSEAEAEAACKLALDRDENELSSSALSYRLFQDEDSEGGTDSK